MSGSVIVITGVMAAGKSSVAQRLAERLPLAMHIRGDLFRRMIVSGRADPTPERPKTGYAGGWTIDAMMADLDGTPRIGLWVDNSGQNVEQTADQILSYVT